MKIKAILKSSKDYPKELLALSAPPEKIFALGNFPLEGRKVAIVGSRRCSNYGKEIAFKLAEELTKAGIVVVSGFAPGIDTFAHLGALSGGGKTLAILGTGLDLKVIYPKSNLKLVPKIVEKGGALISQFEPKVPGSKFTFPKRNQLISALSEAVIIVEAKRKSGALITAKEALKLNKTLIALPGNITSPLSEGTNQLIKEKKALPLTKIEDVFEILKIETKKEKETFENQILKVLAQGAKSAEEISTLLNLPISKVLAELNNLELEGKVINLGAQTYAKR